MIKMMKERSTESKQSFSLTVVSTDYTKTVGYTDWLHTKMIYSR